LNIDTRGVDRQRCVLNWLLVLFKFKSQFMIAIYRRAFLVGHGDYRRMRFVEVWGDCLAETLVFYCLVHGLLYQLVVLLLLQKVLQIVMLLHWDRLHVYLKGGAVHTESAAFLHQHIVSQHPTTFLLWRFSALTTLLLDFNLVILQELRILHHKLIESLSTIWNGLHRCRSIAIKIWVFIRRLIMSYHFLGLLVHRTWVFLLMFFLTLTQLVEFLLKI
jgi:hypothetical protein